MATTKYQKNGPQATTDGQADLGSDFEKKCFRQAMVNISEVGGENDFDWELFASVNGGATYTSIAAGTLTAGDEESHTLFDLEGSINYYTHLKVMVNSSLAGQSADAQVDFIAFDG